MLRRVHPSSPQKRCLGLPGITKNNQKYIKGICPVAEEIQPKIIQFKTNYENLNLAYKQAEVLKKTINIIRPNMNVAKAILSPLI